MGSRVVPTDSKAARLLLANITNDDSRYREPTDADVEKLSLDTAQQAVLSQMSVGALEICAVGDFDPEEFERLLLRFIGSIPSRALPEEAPGAFTLPATASCAPATVTIEDNASRAVLLAGRQVNFNRWVSLDRPDERVLQAYREIVLLSKMINNILYREVREKKSLAYAVSFELSLPQYSDKGMYVLSCSPPDSGKLEACLEACLDVLRNLRELCTEDELQRAQRPILKGLEASMHRNGFWLGQMSNLQDDFSPHSFACTHGISEAYSSVTLHGIRQVVGLLDFTDLVIVHGKTTKITPSRSSVACSSAGCETGEVPSKRLKTAHNSG